VVIIAGVVAFILGGLSAFAQKAISSGTASRIAATGASASSM
jgi:hypothetical protein